MILRGARVARTATEATRLDLRVHDGKVRFSAPESAASSGGANLEGFLVLPGLINAHDHLEFNLFPRLGRGPYPNAAAWAADIYRPDESPVKEQLQIPKRLRLIWGGVKNLISGVTSVLHHNPYEPAVFGPGFPVRVIQRFGWAHSLSFGGDVVEAAAKTPPEAPFLIHAAEGVDDQSAGEIRRLEAAGVLDGRTVIVHGVALDREGVALMKRRGASLVWCPTSNTFTLGRTLSREALDSGIPIALGTDSALTGTGDLADEIEFAARELDAARLYGMVTDVAAKILRLDAGEGGISEGGVADLLIVPDNGQTPAEAVMNLRPELVMVGGRIKLLSPRLADRFPQLAPRDFQELKVERRGEWLIACDMRTLLEAASYALGNDFRLAGKAVAA